MIHELKTHPPFFQAVLEGKKTHEVRKNDRDFRVGDVIQLREYFPPEITETASGEYTGREYHVVITYITPGGAFGLGDNTCVLSIRPWATDAEITQWLNPPGRQKLVERGDRVPLRGHEGHIVVTAWHQHTPETINSSAQCSCFTWFGDNPGDPALLRKLPTDVCTSPTGRTDGHGKYVEVLGGVWVCAFCKMPSSKFSKTKTKRKK